MKSFKFLAFNTIFLCAEYRATPNYIPVAYFPDKIVKN